MSLLRKYLRTEVANRLMGNTIAESRVTTNRGNAVWDEEVPALAIYCRREDVEKLNTSPIRLRRACLIAVELYVGETKGKNISDQIDDLCEQVEQILLPAMHLPGTTEELELDSTDSGLQSVEIDVDAQGEALLGAARLTFLWVYYQNIDELDSVQNEDLGLFERAFVSWDFPPPNGDLEAVDDIAIP